jgi:predicted RNA-binding protein associated with RNAse of E/G family
VGSQTSATITERKTRLDGSVAEYSCERLLLEPGRRAILRYVSDRERRLEGTGLRIPVGTVTVAHYWVDRPYNVYHLLVDGRTLAYYCNVVVDTVIAGDAVAYTDLVVDVVLRTSGAATVLDEDELPDDLAPPHRLALAKALEALITDPRTLIREIERETAAALRPRA